MRMNLEKFQKLVKEDPSALDKTYMYTAKAGMYLIKVFRVYDEDSSFKLYYHYHGDCTCYSIDRLNFEWIDSVSIGVD